MEKRTGRRPAELDGPEVVESAMYLLTLHRDVRRAASPGFDGSIGVGAVLEYQRAFQVTLAPWEIEVLLEIDDVYMEMAK